MAEAAMNETYVVMAKKLGAPVSQKIMRIFETTFSPEEAVLLLELFEPATCKQVAERVKADEGKVYRMLEELAARGVIMKGKTEYCFHSSLIAFHHHVVGGVGVSPTPEDQKKAWSDFFYDDWSDIFVEGYIKRMEQTGWPVHRVWPTPGALALSPNIDPEKILPQEDFVRRLKNTSKIILGHCGCRKNWGKCEHPVETCFAPIQGRGGEAFLGLPDRGTIREVSFEEAMEAVKRNEEAGLVCTGSCFCCTCACEILYSLKRVNRFDLIGKSRFQAVVDESKCVGCKVCEKRCPFGAIEMRPTSDPKKFKAYINADKCWGCGVCITGCKKKALRFEMVRPPSYIIGPKPDGAITGIMCKCGTVK